MSTAAARGLGWERVLGALQSLGRSLMLPIAVLPAAALLLRLGQQDLLDLPWMAAAGQAIFDNLSMIFAVGIAFGLAGGDGAQVFYSPLKPVHVSGHAAQEEQKLMLSLLKPRYLVPVHGEFRHLMHHAFTARSLGIPEERIFVLENGARLEFRGGEARRIENVSSGMFVVDGGGLADTSGAVMRERQQLAEEGMFIVIARIDSQSGALVGVPDVISRGFVDPQAANGLVEASIEVVSRTLRRTASRRITDWGQLKNEIRRDLTSFLAERTNKRPMILPLIVEV